MKGNSYNHKLPEIEILKKHYFGEKLSAAKIAKKYNVTTGAVFIKFRRYGIERRTMSEAQALIGNYVDLVPDLINFLNGLLLGDGCVVVPTSRMKSCWYAHSDKNKTYLKWLAEYFLEFGVKCSNIKCHMNTAWRIQSKSYRNFIDVRNLWYPDGKKKIPKIGLTPITLFNWYIGDGSYDKKSKSHKVVICSQFDQKGKVYMNRLINSIGIKTSIYPQMIYIKKESRPMFFKYITDHKYPIPNCYKYKFPGGINGTE